MIKHARYGAAKQEEKKKTIEKVLGVVKEDMQRISWKEEDAGDSGDGGKWAAVATTKEINQKKKENGFSYINQGNLEMKEKEVKDIYKRVFKCINILTWKKKKRKEL